jgi:hypothetical protein
MQQILLGRSSPARRTIDDPGRATAIAVFDYELDLVKAWGDATSVAADGTQVDTLIDNLLAESHIRYGGYGRIACCSRRRRRRRSHG